MAQIEIRPQEGPQTTFLSSPADVAVYGGAAGGGKTWALLIEPLRHTPNPQFSAVIFRRTFPQIMSEGGLWDESHLVYQQVGAKPRTTDLKWTFPSGSSVRFAHLQHEDNKYDWQGAQIPYIGFDELTHFSMTQFFYLMSRNRSLCGVKPYMRATCNPDALSWVKVFLAPWVDKNSPIKAESGEILWMVRHGERIEWFKDRAEAWDYARNNLPLTEHMRAEHVVKSVTFVAANVYDNKILLEKNPEYLGNLLALPTVERQRLLYGDWDVLPDAGKIFDRGWFEVVQEAPVGSTQPVNFHVPPAKALELARDRSWDVRFWDFAATLKKAKGDDPDYTAGVKVRKHRGRFYVLDVWHGRVAAHQLEDVVRNVAAQDNAVAPCAVRWEEEGGASGKFLSNRLIEVLSGFDARSVRPQGDKVSRAQPAAAQAEAGNVKVVAGPWNEAFLTELHHFPDAPHDDMVDAFSGAFRHLVDYGADVIIGPDIWAQ